MNILITGGRGFVGGFIAQNLKNHKIFCPGKQELNLLNSNQVSAYFDYYNIDVVIHCALTGREVLGSLDPVYLNDGILMFRNLWINKGKFKTLINLGTVYEHSLEIDNTMIKEGDFIHHLPITSYGYAKNIVARIIKDTENFYNLRIFGNFHETESEKRFFKKLLLEDEITIHNDHYIDYLYMPDILPLIECVINDQSQYRDINMVYPTKYRLSEMAQMFCNIHGLNTSKIKVLKQGDKNLTGDPSRFTSFNFNLMGLEEGFRRYK
jgi:nucleoside-diphosphate-sugar epimerase